jgi:hypothetical protein
MTTVDLHDNSICAGFPWRNAFFEAGARRSFFMNRSNDRSNRSVSIGRDATGNVIQTGDDNVASVQFTQAMLPPPESVDINAELAIIRDLLQQLRCEDVNKIDRAIEDAQDEAKKSEPDRDEIGGALDRALKYAKQAEGFADTASKLQQHIANAVSWLGDNWHRLLPIVGLIV